MSSPATRKFHQAAGTYAHEATVQQEVCCRLAGLLPAAPVAGNILELGCGTGMLTAYLLERYPGHGITALDVAAGMIDEAAAKLKSERLKWVVADARNYRTDEKFPLIVSSSALHWMLPLRETLASLRQLLAPQGMLVVSMMVRGTLESLASAREAIAPGKGSSVLLPTSEEVLNVFRQTRWNVERTDQRDYIEHYSSVDALLFSLRRQGVTGKTNPEAKLLSKKELQKFKDYLKRRFARAEGTVQAEYKVLFLQASINREVKTSQKR